MDWERGGQGGGGFYDEDQIVTHERGFGEEPASEDDGAKSKMYHTVMIRQRIQE